MKNTPRYIRLMSLAVSVSAWQLALNFEKLLFDSWLDGYRNTLAMFNLVSQATTLLTLVVLVNVIWIILPQKKGTN
jgi:hypothetical protein